MPDKTLRPGKILLLVFFVAAQLSVSAQNQDDSLLVNRERAKWEALKTKSFGAHPEWFSREMISIGYLPNNMVYRTGFGDKISFPKMDEFPAADFTVSGFKIVNATADVKIVSYQAEGPISVYVTSVWARKDNEWKTVSYQATKYK
ncbi:MAG: hypothetical protein JWQ27_2174 [Ferruginibacter sp.]|nr:hypothetical protein [Ferruginibacter sp.]